MSGNDKFNGPGGFNGPLDTRRLVAPELLPALELLPAFDFNAAIRTSLARNRVIEPHFQSLRLDRSKHLKNQLELPPCCLLKRLRPLLYVPSCEVHREFGSFLMAQADCGLSRRKSVGREQRPPLSTIRVESSRPCGVLSRASDLDCVS